MKYDLILNDADGDRIIIIVDGLDSVEQKKVVQVLDLVHALFSGMLHSDISSFQS